MSSSGTQPSSGADQPDILPFGGDDPPVRPARSGLKRLLGYVVGVGMVCASVWYLSASFSAHDSWEAIEAADWGRCLAAGLSSWFVFCVLRTERWRALLNADGVYAPWMTLFRATCIGIGAAVFSPAQVGEAVKLEVLRQSLRFDRRTCYRHFVVEKVCDLVVVCLFSAFLLLHPAFRDAIAAAPSHHWLPLMLAALLGVVSVGLLVRKRSAAATANRDEAISSRSILLHPTRSALKCLGWTAAGWLVIGFVWQQLFASVGVSVGLLIAVGLTGAVTLLRVASLVPGGVGVSEAGIATLLAMLGATTPAALASALLVRGYGLMTVGLGGAAAFVLAPAGRSQAAASSTGGPPAAEHLCLADAAATPLAAAVAVHRFESQRDSESSAPSRSVRSA